MLSIANSVCQSHYGYQKKWFLIITLEGNARIVQWVDLYGFKDSECFDVKQLF